MPQKMIPNFLSFTTIQLKKNATTIDRNKKKQPVSILESCYTNIISKRIKLNIEIRQKEIRKMEILNIFTPTKSSSGPKAIPKKKKTHLNL